MRSLSPLTLIALALLALFAVVNVTRPLLPIDETRYLSVAWEFFTRGEYILPTLNFEPYHHKPPMLFWLINAWWSFFGTTDIWAARLVTLIGSLGTLLLTHKIARVLWPEEKTKADLAVLMMAATPFFLIYGSLVMFDTLLTIAVLIGVYALLKFYQGGSRWYFMLLGLALGLGALIKGPVILVHLLPVILLFPLIQRSFIASRSLWFQGLIFALIIGTVIGLAWALPAAKIGGPEYQDMIFRGQSADRMVNSFDHARPFWFYLAALPAMLLPWFFVPRFWRRDMISTKPRTWQSRFLLTWIIPVIVIFMMISGKQVHYLIPILPGIFMLLAHYIISRGILDRLSPLRFYIAAIAPIGLIALALIGTEIFAKTTTPTASFLVQLSTALPHFLILGLVVVYLVGRRIKYAGYDQIQTLRAIFIAHVAIIIALHFNLAPMLKKYYDLTPVANIIAPYAVDAKPIAVARAWHGEVGYLAHLTKNVAVIQTEQMAGWLARHPRGIVILRHDAGKVPKGYKVIYSQPYRSPNKSISILGK